MRSACGVTVGLLVLIATVLNLSTQVAGSQRAPTIRDKTRVARVVLANLSRRGGSARIADARLCLNGKDAYTISGGATVDNQLMFYKAKSKQTGNMWDTWLYLHLEPERRSAVSYRRHDLPRPAKKAFFAATVLNRSFAQSPRYPPSPSSTAAV